MSLSVLNRLSDLIDCRIEYGNDMFLHSLNEPQKNKSPVRAIYFFAFTIIYAPAEPASRHDESAGTYLPAQDPELRRLRRVSECRGPLSALCTTSR